MIVTAPTPPVDVTWDERVRWYRETYLTSDWWRLTRQVALERAGHKCQLCASDCGPLQVHHRSYDRLGCEEPEDLTVLCDGCHGAHHKRHSRQLAAEDAEDRARADVEARRQLALVIIAAAGGCSRKRLTDLTGWKGHNLGHALGGLRNRGLIEMRGKGKAGGTYELTPEGQRVARDLFYNPEPLYWRIPPDPTRDRSRSDERSSYRNIGALEQAHRSWDA